MSAQTLPATHPPKPDANIGMTDVPRVRLCLALGAVALAGGCALGYALPAHRSWVLLLLTASVLLFAAALALQWRGSAHAGHETVTMTPAGNAHAEPAQGASASAATPASRTAVMDDAKANASLLALSAPLPKSASVAAPAAAPKAAVVPAPTPAAVPAPTPVPSPGAAPGPSTDAALDVAHLMQAPLADLLLAALCKDPDGARRIFTQAVLQSDAASAAADARPATDVPQLPPRQGTP